MSGISSTPNWSMIPVSHAGRTFATIATLILVPIFYTLLRRHLPTLHLLDKRFEAEAAGSAAGGSVHG